MAKKQRSAWVWFFVLFLATAWGLVPLAMAAEDEDEPIGLSPVEKGDTKKDENLTTEKVKATPVPTAVPAAAPTAVPTVKPTPRPKPTPKPVRKKQPARVKVQSVTAGMEGDELVVEVKGSGPLVGQAQSLKNPDRIVLDIANAALATSTHQVDINNGSALRARMSQKGSSVRVVVDLTDAVAFKTDGDRHYAYALKLATGGRSALGPRSSTAQVPKINLMLFDRNIMFGGRQYDKFPCANLIYESSEPFPLEREFSTTLVFFQGYGTFVGNIRILGPNGAVIDQTRTPFAFNLFSPITDYSVEESWKIKFPTKGFYSIMLTLNGEDVLKHEFYVGHNDDNM